MLSWYLYYNPHQITSHTFLDNVSLTGVLLSFSLAWTPLYKLVYAIYNHKSYSHDFRNGVISESGFGCGKYVHESGEVMCMTCDVCDSIYSSWYCDEYHLFNEPGML